MQDAYKACPCGSGKKFKFCCLKNPKFVPATLVKTEQGREVYRSPDLVHDVPALLGVDGKQLREELFEPAALVMGIFHEMGQRSAPTHVAAKIVEDIFEIHHDLHLHILQILLVKVAKKHPDIAQLASGFSCLGEALEKLRYSIDRNRHWAKAMAQKFQEIISEIVLKELRDTETALRVASLLREAKLPISPLITEAMAEVGADEHRNVQALPSPEALAQVFENLVKETGSQDPFEVYENIIADTSGLKADQQRVIITGLALSKSILARDAAALGFLHEAQFIRAETAKLFLAEPSTIKLTPDGLRRLICLRNWLPASERSLVDDVIRRTRQAGVECAPLPRPELKVLMASPFDGSGGGGIWGHSQLGNVSSLFGVYVRQGFGIRDAWVNADVSKKEIRNVMSQIVSKAGSQPVSLPYANMVLSYFLSVSSESGHVPSIHLLRVAETMGQTMWTASREEFTSEVQSLRDESQGSPQSELVKGSATWMGRPFAQSWFEDQPDVDALVTPYAKKLKGNPHKFESLAKDVIDQVVAKKREVWAERLDWMALFSRASSDKILPKPIEFVAVADEIRTRPSLTELPFMLEVGRLSVASAQQRAIVHGLT